MARFLESAAKILDLILRDLNNLKFWKKNKIKTSKLEIILQIFFVFIVPVLLFQVGVIPVSLRLWVLVIIVSLFLFILAKEKWTLAIMHLETDTIKKFVWPYVIFTIIGVIIVSFFGEKIGREELAIWWRNSHFIYLFFIVSVFQEVAYRGYLIPALQKIFNSPILVIFLNALIFTYMHSIFGNLQISLFLAFIGGLGFAIMYIKYPNLILITLSHAALNFTAVLYGFFLISK